MAAGQPGPSLSQDVVAKLLRALPELPSSWMKPSGCFHKLGDPFVCVCVLVIRARVFGVIRAP